MSPPSRTVRPSEVHDLPGDDEDAGPNLLFGDPKDPVVTHNNKRRRFECSGCGAPQKKLTTCANPKCIELRQAKEAMGKKRRIELPPSPLPPNERRRKDIAIDFLLGLNLIEGAFRDLYEHVGEEERERKEKMFSAK